MRRLPIILAAIGITAALPVLAAPDPVVRNSVAVCDPWNPTTCLAPNSAGGLPGPAPSSSASVGIAPVVSGSAESSHVLKASAGNLYTLQVTSGTTAGYVLTFDATSAPADGAVTPKHCFVLPASSSVSLSWSTPAAFATGIVAVFSSTGCFTKTASATAFFSAGVK